MHLIHVWTIQAPVGETPHLETLEPNKHKNPRWQTIDTFLKTVRGKDIRIPYADAITKAIRRHQSNEPIQDVPQDQPAPIEKPPDESVPATLQEVPEMYRLRRRLNLLAAAASR